MGGLGEVRRCVEGEVGAAKAVRGCPEGCYMAGVARLSQRESERTPHTLTHTLLCPEQSGDHG